MRKLVQNQLLTFNIIAINEFDLTLCNQLT